jgi:PAS domain-containing protein
MDLRYDLPFFRLLTENYHRLLGHSLTPEGMTAEQATRWLYEEAPFGILAHNAETDPIFIYGNKAAQRRFEYEWAELITLPSRLSAVEPDRAERQRFLEQVAQHGFSTGYRGVRITKSGKLFRIENATLWQLTDTEGLYRGQAAMLPEMIDL